MIALVKPLSAWCRALAVNTLPFVREHVHAENAILYTDALRSYEQSGNWRGSSPEFDHQVTDHAIAYVQGDVHTNTTENFWALVKRMLKGTYVSTEPFHLFRYLDEQVFRFNNRKATDAMRFALGLKGIINKRLTYTALTGSGYRKRAELSLPQKRRGQRRTLGRKQGEE